MYSFMKRILLQTLRVPNDPEPPAGSPDSIRVFRAGPRLYYWNLFHWAFLQLFAVMGLFGTFAMVAKVADHATSLVGTMLHVGELLGVAGFLAQLPFTFWKQKLDYEMRWYIVTDRSLRIRSGLWSVQEITMTFANIQKVQMARGPLQKLLGLATVEVSSAGGGAGSKENGKPQGADRHAARFEGVANAAEIRDLILERLRRYRDAGLGDTPHEAGPSAAEDLLAAAKALGIAYRR